MTKKCMRIVFVSLLAVVFTANILFAQKLQTPAEKANYSQGGTKYAPLMEFVYELQSQTELMNVQKLTTTLAGRDIVLCILSDPPIFKPEDVHKTGKPVVLIANNVHGSEYAGKDASMEIMRDLVQGDLRPLLDKVVVLNIPTINPDGAEANRRTNEQNFDMNRDYIKLESQEIQALVVKVINEWQPDIHLDTHHGGSDPYVLTFQTCMNPAGDSELIRYGNERILSRVRAALRTENYDGFWYSGTGRVGGVEGWTPTSVEPRKQHVYSTLANMIGFLFETPGNSYRVTENGTKVVPIPREERYKHQVRGQYLGQRELIRFAADNGPELKKVIGDAMKRAMDKGNNDADNDQIPLKYKQVENFKENFWVRKGQQAQRDTAFWRRDTTVAQRGAAGVAQRGAAGVAQRGVTAQPPQQPAPVEYELVYRPIFTKFEPTVTTTRPWGYFLPPSLAKVIPLLHDQGITVKRLTKPVSVEVEVYSATKISHDQYYQGHYLKEAEVTKSTETLTMPAGSFFIPTGQPRSNLLCYILEPETEDNIITWGYLDDFLTVSAARPEGAEGAPAAAAAPQRQPRPQRIPIYRLMKKTNLPTEIVQLFNQYDRNRFIK